MATPSAPWTNQPITLYHGTSLKSALVIQKEGISTSKGRLNVDFGNGFYTTTSIIQADVRSRVIAKGTNLRPAIVALRIDRLRLRELRSLAFVRGELSSLNYWSFLEHCRLFPGEPPVTAGYYDVVYGPVAKTWFPNERSIWKDYDQISFHGEGAESMLNDGAHCVVEVMI